MNKTFITVLTSTSEYCNKGIRVDENGNKEDITRPFYSGMAVKKPVSNLTEFKHILSDVSSHTNQCIILGFHPGVPQDTAYILTPKSDVSSLSRLKETMVQSNIVLFDKDDGDAKFDQWVTDVDSFIPTFKKAEKIVKLSNSARLDKSVVHKWHCFVWVENANDLYDFGDRSLSAAYAAGHGLDKMSKSGSHLQRTIFDCVVFSPERIVYEGKPTTNNGEVLPVSITHIDGEKLDTSLTKSVNGFGKFSKKKKTIIINNNGEKKVITVNKVNTTPLIGKLFLDTPIITTKDFGDCSMQHIIDKNYKLSIRCQIPNEFRNSKSWNGIISRHNGKGSYFLYDNGTGIKYTLSERISDWFDDEDKVYAAVKNGDSNTIKDIVSKSDFTTKELNNNAIDWYRVDDDGKPLAITENIELIMSMNKIRLQLNLMNYSIETQGIKFNDSSKVDAAITHLEDLAIEYGMPYTRIKNMIKPLASKHKYHPFDAYLTRGVSRWDGKDRIKELIDTLDLNSNKEDCTMLLTKWLVSIVAAVRREKNQDSLRLVCILYGAQNVGKTSFFKRLMPDISLFKEGAHLDPTNVDSRREATSHLLCELGEIDSTFNKNKVAQLKAFLSNDMDIMRLPYDKGSSHFKRQTVFCGTVNDKEFFTDQSGNSRFFVLDINGIDHKKYNLIDIDQLWGQVLHLFDTGTRWTLNSSELSIVDLMNNEHNSVSFIYMQVKEKYSWEKIGRLDKTITEIAKELGIESAAVANKKAQIDLKHALSAMTSCKKDSKRGTIIYSVPHLNPTFQGDSQW